MKDTKLIVLGEIAHGEFDRMQRFWGTKIKRKRRGRVHSRIRNPLRFEIGEDRVASYYMTLRSLVSYAGVSEVSINNNWRWMRADRSTNSEKLMVMARIDSQKPLKIQYIEMKFGNDANWNNRATIEFAEHRNRIIGYQVCLPSKYSQLFTVLTQNKYLWNNGLWAPSDYRELPSFRSKESQDQVTDL